MDTAETIRQQHQNREEVSESLEHRRWSKVHVIHVGRDVTSLCAIPRMKLHLKTNKQEGNNALNMMFLNLVQVA